MRTNPDLAGKGKPAVAAGRGDLLPQLKQIQEETENQDIKVATDEVVRRLNLPPADGFSFGIISVQRNEPVVVDTSLHRVERIASRPDMPASFRVAADGPLRRAAPG
jgi:hypothetical protein